MSRRSVLTTVNVPDCIDCREPLTFLRSVRRVSHVGGWGGMPRHARRRHSRILAHDGRGRCRLGGAFEERDTGPYTYMAWASGPGGDIGHPERVQCQYSEAEAVADLSGKAWAAEYAARPRLER
jgi:hypothetical protein